MRSFAALTCSLALLVGCAQRHYSPRYNEYKVPGSPHPVVSEQAEAEYIAAANAKLRLVAAYYDKPLELLSAPQPTIPASDALAGVVGEVTVRLVFSETGEVESATIVKSTKESLSEAVRQAVLRWRMTPATSKGKPVKVVMEPQYRFKAD